MQESGLFRKPGSHEAALMELSLSLLVPCVQRHLRPDLPTMSDRRRKRLCAAPGLVDDFRFGHAWIGRLSRKHKLDSHANCVGQRGSVCHHLPSTRLSGAAVSAVVGRKLPLVRQRCGTLVNESVSPGRWELRLASLLPWANPMCRRKRRMELLRSGIRMQSG